jgi:hypothetical protein
VIQKQRTLIFPALFFALMAHSFACSSKDEQPRNNSSEVKSEAPSAATSPNLASKVGDNKKGEGLSKRSADTPGSLPASKPSANKPLVEQSPKPSSPATAVQSADGRVDAVREAEDSIEYFHGIPATPKGLDVVAVAAVKSLTAIDKVIELINGSSKKEGGETHKAVKDFQKTFGLKDASWLRKDAPIYVILSDIKQDAGGRSLVLPITDEASVKRAIKGLKKKTSHHDADLVVDGKPVYLDLIADQAVISYSDKFFKRLKPYLEGSFKRIKPVGLVSFQLDIKTIRKLYGNEISGRRGWLKESLVTFFGFQKLGLQEGKSLDGVIDLVYSFLESTSNVGLSLSLEKENLVLRYGFTALKGKTLDRVVQEMRGRRSGLHSLVHPEAWLALAAYFDLRTLKESDETSQNVVQMMTSLLKLDAKGQAAFLNLLEKRRLNQRGDSLIQFYQDGAFPFALATVSTVENASLERRVHGDLMNQFFQLLMAGAKDKLKGNRMAGLLLNDTSFSDLMGKLSLVAEPMGIGLKTTSETKGKTSIDGFTISMDWAKSPLKERIPNAALIQQVIGDRLSIAAAYHGTKVAIAFGPNAIAHAQGMVEGKGFGGQKEFTETLKKHAVAGVLRLGSIAKLIMKYGLTLSPELLGLGAMGKAATVQFNAKSDGSKGLFQVSVPAPALRALR